MTSKTAGDGVRLVCFDLGRVLIRICDNWQHACQQAGIGNGAVKLDNAARARLHDAVCRSEVGTLDLQGFAVEAGPLLGLSPEQVEAMSDAYLLEPFPGVVEILAELRSRKMRTACLSNTNASHWRLLTAPGAALAAPLRHLDHQFASHLLGLRKPDPAIYAHVEQVTGCSAGSILFFDDLPENVEAAGQRGWHAVQIDPASDPVPQIRRGLAAHGVT